MPRAEGPGGGGGAGAGGAGPLARLKVVEFAGLGPVPFASMMLSDMGADVVTLARAAAGQPRAGVLMRGRRHVAVDLKDQARRAELLALIGAADVLLEGFRPGVMERLGLGPDEALACNPRLVYGRMTGWGQTGPLARAAGHDINYIALAGALHAIGGADGPVPPLNLVGDYGGGAMFLLTGVLAALFEARRSGKGQVVDCAMCDGVTSLMSLFGELAANGRWTERRGANLLDGGAHFYGAYECADGAFISVGAIEPQFYAELLERVGATDPAFSGQMDRAGWPALRGKLAQLFKTRTRAEWCSLLEGTDACFAPVLSLSEAREHPHMVAREAYVVQDGSVQPAPAPRFSRTPSSIKPSAATDLAECARLWGAAGEEDQGA